MSGGYPQEWPEVAKSVKDKSGWRCARCGHPHELPGQRVPCDELCDPKRHSTGLNDGKQRGLTVHHLDGDKQNLAWWNLAPLCQACHLRIQAKVKMDRPWRLLEHSSWFKPYVGGYYAKKYMGLDLSREEVEANLEQYAGIEAEGLLAICPRCGQWQLDLDGFGVVKCIHCDFCTHASRTGGVCDLCGDTHHG